MAAYLITGASGSGKSTVGACLKERGYDVVETDFEPGLSGFFDKTSGKRVRNYTFPLTSEQLETYQWNWDKARMNALLATGRRRVVFFCGGADNESQFFDRFAMRFALQVDNESLLRRLQHREPARWADGSPELREQLKWNTQFLKLAKAGGATVIDAMRRPEEIADDIEAIVKKYEQVDGSGGMFIEAMSRRLSVHRFDAWHPTIDSALKELPELEYCPAVLLRELYEVSACPKRLALVTLRDRPVAVVPLKFDGGYWRPITTWNLPATLVPSKPNAHIEALAALGGPVAVSWWRAHPPLPPYHPAIRDRRDSQSYILPITGPEEPHWGETGLLRKVRVSRKRCAHLRVDVNASGAAEWVIRNWGKNFSTSSVPLPLSVEQMAVAKYWEARGKHVTITLAEGDEIVAGDTLFMDSQVMVALCTHRRKEYDHLKIGTRLLDAVHEYGFLSGIGAYDLGDGHDYMKQWSPQGGVISRFVVEGRGSLSSRFLAALRRVGSGVRRIA